MKLENNQILITISNDKKEITIDCGAMPYSMTFDNCPKKTIENISNCLKEYNNKTGLTELIPEWVPDGCGYENNGTCYDCN